MIKFCFFPFILTIDESIFFMIKATRAAFKKRHHMLQTTKIITLFQLKNKQTAETIPNANTNGIQVLLKSMYLSTPTHHACNADKIMSHDLAVY